MRHRVVPGTCPRNLSCSTCKSLAAAASMWEDLENLDAPKFASWKEQRERIATSSIKQLQSTTSREFDVLSSEFTAEPTIPYCIKYKDCKCPSQSNVSSRAHNNFQTAISRAFRKCQNHHKGQPGTCLPMGDWSRPPGYLLPVLDVSSQCSITDFKELWDTMDNGHDILQKNNSSQQLIITLGQFCDRYLSQNYQHV